MLFMIFLRMRVGAKGETADSQDSESLGVQWESLESWEYGEIFGVQ
jgi:hypothetical protein